MGRKPIENVSLKELLKQYKNGSMDARDVLFFHYVDIAREIASDFFHLGIDDEDVVFSAYEGLLVEINSLKTKLSSSPFSSIRDRIKYFVKMAILDFYGLNGSDFSPVFKNIFVAILKAKRDLLKENNIPPTICMISDRVKVSEREVRCCLDIASKVRSECFYDVYYGEVDPYEKIECEDLCLLVRNVISSSYFTDLERVVISERYLNSEVSSVRELARKLRCSSSNVFNVEARALRKLRNSILIQDYVRDKNELKFML